MKPLAFGGVALLAAVAVTSVGIRAQRETSAAPTFNHDVAPILFSNCVSCHRPGQIAPMSLTSYKEARPWARAIKAKVAAREMPPWPPDPRFGHFRNGRSFTPEQISTIAAWVDRGAPEGDGTPPALPQFAEVWNHPSGRPPDAIIDMPFEMEIPAGAQFPWFTIYQKWPFQEDKFVEAVQILPGNRAIAHHITTGIRTLKPGQKIGSGLAWPGGPVLSNILLNSDGTPLGRASNSGDGVSTQEGQGVGSQEGGLGSLLIYVPPVGFQEFRPGVGKRIPKDSYLSWGLHYTTTGKAEKDRSRLGIWFQRVPMTTVTVTKDGGTPPYIAAGQEIMLAPRGLAGAAGIPVIPPYVDNWAITNIAPFQDDATIHLVWPHMHLRGKDMTYLLTYPDGREEVIESTPHYKFGWQMFYEFEQPVKVPAGSTLKILAHYDNSVKNRDNPAPDKEVYWSEQSWDEMFSGFYDVSIDKLDRPVDTASASSTSR